LFSCFWFNSPTSDGRIPGSRAGRKKEGQAVKQTFAVSIESDHRIKSSTIQAVLTQDLPGVAKDGSGTKVEEESYSIETLKVNRPSRKKPKAKG
jgi:hypothetical protein